jgi:transposase InsO family protein
VNDELCELTGMESRMTSAYHPQTNGLDERFNQTLQRQLLKLIDKEQKEWDLYLDVVLFSYRVSKQDSTKFTPFFLMYGRKARLPVEFDLGTEEVDEVPEDLDLDSHIQKMIEIRKRALLNIEVAQERQKKYYNSKHSKDQPKFKVGALVLLKNSRKLSRKGSKLEPNWTGPYKIHEVMGKGTFRLSNQKNKVLATLYNMTRLKLYHERSPGAEVGIAWVTLYS